MNLSNVWKSIMYAIKGAIIGVGAILPGISGGVLCVAFGIYEPMMLLFTRPKESFKKYYKMFIPFIIGWVIGFVFLARGVEILFNYSPTIALMLFFGLISGTIPELFKTSEKSDPSKSWTSFVISLTLAYLFFHILENSVAITLDISFVSCIFCGALWGISIIVPGLSSSTILIFLGLYEPLTAGIADLKISVIGPFIIGIIITVLLFARVITMLFDKHYAIISRIILGFVVASSLKILPTNFKNPATFAISFVCFVVGFIIARAMDIAKAKQA